ncbi:hypothetical protein V8C86DRAFT_3033838 [Haematococcus lacustris]
MAPHCCCCCCRWPLLLPPVEPSRHGPPQAPPGLLSETPRPASGAALPSPPQPQPLACQWPAGQSAAPGPHTRQLNLVMPRKLDKNTRHLNLRCPGSSSSTPTIQAAPLPTLRAEWRSPGKQQPHPLLGQPQHCRLPGPQYKWLGEVVGRLCQSSSGRDVR